MKQLVDELRTLVNGEFSGFIKINFSQGSLGRVEKSEEFEDLAGNVDRREQRQDKRDELDMRNANA